MAKICRRSCVGLDQTLVIAMTNPKTSKLHQLDTRQALLGTRLRQVFDAVLNEPVTDEQLRLVDELERALSGQAVHIGQQAQGPRAPDDPDSSADGGNPSVKRDIRS
jgi:hypothetical protein